MNQLRFFDHGLADFGEVGGLSGEFIEAALHALDSPEEIDGGGAGFCERVADFWEFGAQGFYGNCGGMEDAESGSHGGGYADGGCAANDHVADGFGDFAV